MSLKSIVSVFNRAKSSSFNEMSLDKKRFTNSILDIKDDLESVNQKLYDLASLAQEGGFYDVKKEILDLKAYVNQIDKFLTSRELAKKLGFVD